MLLCLLILKMLLLSWFASKNCLRIPVVMVPCSVWKLKWTKKMVLGKQGLKISLSISGCPSSSCRGQMFGNKEKSNSNSVSKRTCTVNVVQVLTKKLTAWELSLSPLQSMKKVTCRTVSLFFEVLCHRTQKHRRRSASTTQIIRTLHKELGGGSPMEVLYSYLNINALNLLHVSVYKPL